MLKLKRKCVFSPNGWFSDWMAFYVKDLCFANVSQ